MQGASVTDTATITGGNNPTGTIIFDVYSGSTSAACTGTPVATQTVTLPTASATFGSGLAAGSYEVQATYSGDANNAGPVSSPCGSEPLTVTRPWCVQRGHHHRIELQRERHHHGQLHLVQRAHPPHLPHPGQRVDHLLYGPDDHLDVQQHRLITRRSPCRTARSCSALQRRYASYDLHGQRHWVTTARSATRGDQSSSPA